ncbi:hornerin-like [Amyelois transitella]|uniref:hornerin-like n=1 Tax=Amyelois transitella TaxID=680683 RepID=UPI002990313D|nr:hornerin-like [Amyelois transitella]
MKLTVALIAILSISSSWAKELNKAEDPKDKREAAIGYGSQGISAHSYQAPIGHEGGNSISVGAGYSVGGTKPSYSFGGHSASPLQFAPEGLQSSGHATIKLPPITLQPSHGLAAGDLSQLMSQLSHSINSGALNLQAGGFDSYALAAAPQAEHGAQELSLPQYTFGAPKLQQYTFQEQPQVASPPSYAAGTKGLGSYGSTGPVLFTPSDSQANVALQSHAPSSGHSFEALGPAYAIGAAPSSGHSYGGAAVGHSFGEGALSGHSFGGAGLSLGQPGHSLGGSGHSLGGSGHTVGAGYTLGGSSHSLGGLSLGSSGNSYGGSYKTLLPSKGSFKPSAFLGSSIQGDSSHGLSSLSSSHGAPSFGSFSSGGHSGLSLASLSHGSSFGGHAPSFGGHGSSFGGSSTKYLAAFAPSKSEGYGNTESVSNFASSGHLSSPGSSFSSPSSYGHSNNVHSASSSSPQYYVPSSKYSSSSFGEGRSSYKSPSSHGSLSSFSSGPKHSYGRVNRYSPPKDIEGSYSENTYNTIKYSEELKPRTH